MFPSDVKTGEALATDVFIGLGSNLSDPVSQLKKAGELICALEGLAQVQISPFYRTEPLGSVVQPDFINAVVRCKSVIPPFSLLRKLQQIETDMGRQRSDKRWEPRVIDIDLLIYGQLSLYTCSLILPHDQIPLRRFVLVPMNDLVDEYDIPFTGKLSELLARAPELEMEKI